MRNQQCGTPGHEALEGLMDEAFVLRIKVGGGLVEEQNRGVFEDSPGNGEALALTTRQLHAALPEAGVVALREMHDKLMRMGLSRRLFEFRIGRVWASQTQILTDAGVKQIGVLRHQGHLLTQRIQRVLAHVMTTEHDTTVLNVPETQQQVHGGRFPRTGAAHQGHRLPALHRKAHLT